MHYLSVGGGGSGDEARTLSAADEDEDSGHREGRDTESNLTNHDLSPWVLCALVFWGRADQATGTSGVEAKSRAAVKNKAPKAATVLWSELKRAVIVVTP